ncbi:MAG: hypothetical protein WC698_03965 [Candidatus Peribacteraceae bacterium]
MPSRNRPHSSPQNGQIPKRNRPQSRRKPSLETLEKRYLMTGAEGEFTGEELELMQENYADYIGNILLREDQWDEESLARLIDGSVGDNEFIGLGNLISSMEDKRDLLRSMDTRSDLLEEDLAGIEAEITQDTEELERQVATISASTARISELAAQVENDISEINRLTDAIAALREEDRVGDENIAMLEQNLPSYQAKLEEVTEDRVFLEYKVETMGARVQQYGERIPVLEKLVERYPQSRVYQRMLLTTRIAYRDASDAHVRYKDQLAVLTIIQHDLQTTITDTTDMLTTLHARDAAIPEEIDAAEEGRNEAAARKQEAEEEHVEVAGILALAEEASDALEADLLRAAAMHEMDEEMLTDIATDIVQGVDDLMEMRNVLRTTMEELLGAEEEPLANTDTVSQQVALMEGSLQEDGSWLMNLPEIGGTASFGAWPKVGGLTMSSLEGALLHRALVGAGITQEQIDASPALGTLLGLEEGHQQGTVHVNEYIILPLRTKTVALPTLGTATIQTHLWKPPDQRSNSWAFLLNQQGVVSGGFVDFNNNYAVSNAQSGPISLTLAEPRYVQWVEIKHLGGDNHGTLVVTRADGSTYPIYLSSGNAQIAIDEPILGLRINPLYSNSLYGFDEINTDAPVGIPDIPAGEKWLNSNGFVTALDLHNAGKMVSEVKCYVKADRPNVPVTAYAYRGDTLIATQEVGADGMVHMTDEGGITSVVLAKNDQTANLIVSPVATTGWKDLPQPEADPLSTANNGKIALHGAMPWGVVPANYYALMQKLGVNFNWGLHITDERTGYRIFPGITNTAGYTLHQVNTGDAVGIREVLYFTGDGHGGSDLYKLPPSYWSYVDGKYGKAIITYPGCPTHIVFGVGGLGTFLLDANARTGERLTDVMPVEEMKLEVTDLYSRREPADEGWVDVPMEGTPGTNFHGGGGDEFSMLFGVYNLGIGGGSVTARVHVGQSGSADDPVVKEFTGEITSLSRQALWINTALRQSGDWVTLEILDSEGVQRGIDSRKIHPPRVGEMTETERQAEMGSRRIQTLNAKIVDAVHNSPTLDNWRESVSSSGQSMPTMETLEQSLKLTNIALQKEHDAFLERGVSAEELHALILAKLKDIVINRGYLALAGQDLDTALSYDAIIANEGNQHGSAPDMIDIDAWDDEKTEEVMNEMLLWFHNPNPHEPLIMHGKIVETNSRMGRIFAGFFQKAIAADSDEDLRMICAKVSKVIGIDQRKLFIMASSSDVNQFFDRLSFLFEEVMGFNYVLEETLPSGYTPDRPVRVSTEYSYYRNGNIRVYFDLPMGIDGVGIGYNYVYLINQITGEQINWRPGQQYFGQALNQLYVDIPVEWIGEATGGRCMPIMVKVVSWQEGAQVGTDPHIFGISERSIEVQWDGSFNKIPEGATNLLSILPSGQDYYEGHVGGDYTMINDRAAVQGDEIWLPQIPGATIRVVDAQPVSGYGTMAVKFEIKFTEPKTFKTEIQMDKVIDIIENPEFQSNDYSNCIPAIVDLQHNPKLLEEVRSIIVEYRQPNADKPNLEEVIAKKIGIQNHITTDTIRLFAGHLRPSKDVVWDDNAQNRFDQGKDELPWIQAWQQTPAGENYFVRGAIRIGYLEMGDLDWREDVRGRDYAGYSYGPHLHVGSIAAIDAVMETWAGNGVGILNPYRIKYIRPEELFLTQ